MQFHGGWMGGWMDGWVSRILKSMQDLRERQQRLIRVMSAWFLLLSSFFGQDISAFTCQTLKIH